MDIAARTALQDRTHQDRLNQLHRKPGMAGKGSPGCCSSPHTRRCCIVTTVFGGIFALIGILLLVGGKDFVAEKILKSMALSPGSKRLATWLVPPVQAHLTGYGFSVTNPEEVMRGEKPILKEVGPFVYKAITVKDSVDEETQKANLEYNEDGETLTYRPRKFYYLDRAQSAGDPDTTYITVPNIPMLTGMRKMLDTWKAFIGRPAILNTGRGGSPFINVTFSGLLWGYADDMPCMQKSKPAECGFLSGLLGGSSEDTDTGGEDTATVETVTDTSESSDDDDFFNQPWDDDMPGWDRRKRSVRCKRETQEVEEQEIELPNVDLRTLKFSTIESPTKEEFVDCKCIWGLFRDRNVTIRKPLKIHHGMGDLSKKGWIEEFDGKTSFGWWQEGSKCDEVGGQDTSTLPPSWTKDMSLDFFTSLMCRRLKLDFTNTEEHAGMETYRYIPNINQFGYPHDEDPEVRNEENGCYCVEGFTCFKYGVFNLEPCKRKPDLPRGAPVALSYPHFYQAHPSFREAVVGLEPNKTKHEFYIDVEPTFGFPLAIRPRFQLNAIMRKDPKVTVLSEFVDELVVPFLWFQDGFSEPSEEMVNAMKLDMKVPGLAVDGVEKCTAVMGDMVFMRSLKAGTKLTLLPDILPMEVRRNVEDTISGWFSLSFSTDDGGEASLIVGTNGSIYGSVNPGSGDILYAIEPCGEGCNVLLQRNRSYFNNLED